MKCNWINLILNEGKKSGLLAQQLINFSILRRNEKIDFALPYRAVGRLGGPFNQSKLNPLTIPFHLFSLHSNKFHFIVHSLLSLIDFTDFVCFLLHSFVVGCLGWLVFPLAEPLAGQPAHNRRRQQRQQPQPTTSWIAQLFFSLNFINSSKMKWMKWRKERGRVSLICLFFCLLPFGGAPAAGSGHNPPKARKEKTNQSSSAAANARQFFLFFFFSFILKERERKEKERIEWAAASSSSSAVHSQTFRKSSLFFKFVHFSLKIR